MRPASMTLDRVDRDPWKQFRRWYAEAVKAERHLPEAMTLATASRRGLVTARTVLYKEVSRNGIVFFTNYRSRKGRQLADNAQAALVFHWKPLARQVVVEGRVEKISRAESVRYFRTRPRDSQVGAWASPQGEVIPDRNFLEDRVRKFEAQFHGGPVPCPPHWGGYRLTPVRMEFWQGRVSRLHDRFHYTRVKGRWAAARLAP